MPVKFCPECGTPPLAGAKFCSQCGLNFSTLNAVEGGRGAEAKKHTPLSAALHEGTTTPAVSVKAPPIPLGTPGLVVPAVTTSQQVLIVCQQGNGDFTTIGEALQHAHKGARVVVRKGIYEEHLLIEYSVNLVADDGTAREQVIIATDGCAALYINGPEAEDVLVRGMSFISRRRDPRENVPNDEDYLPDDVICIERGDNIRIENCVIQCVGNPISPPQMGQAFWFQSVSNIKVSGFTSLTVAGCLIDGGDEGISLRGGGFQVDKFGQRTEIDVHSQKVVLSDCEVRGFSRIGVGSTRIGKLEITRCNIHSAFKLQSAEPDRYGISLGSRLDKPHERRTEEVLIEECDIHYTGFAGIDASFVAERGGGKPFICSAHVKVTMRHCRISHAEEFGVKCLGGVLEMDNCVVSDNGKKSKNDVFLTSAGVRKDGTTLLLTNCRLTRNGYGVRVPRADAPDSQHVQFDDLSFVEITAHNCDLTGNELGSWRLPQSVKLQSSGVREHNNNSVMALLFRKSDWH